MATRAASERQSRRGERIGCLLILFLLLTSCGRGRAKPTPEPITLNFAARRQIADYQALATQFQQLHPGVTIHLIDIDVFRGQGINAIDLMDVDAVRWGADYLKAERIEKLVPLDEILLADDALARGNFFAGALEALRLQGIQLGVPAGIDFLVAYYDAQRFQIAGAQPPPADWTHEDLLAAAVAVNRTEGQAATSAEFTYGFCTLPDSIDPVVFTYLFGGRLFDGLPEPTRPTFNEPANIEAIQWYTSLRLEYGVAPDPEELRRAFPRGQQFEAIVRGKCGLWFGQYSDRGGRAWPAEWQGKGVMLPLPRVRAPFGLVQVDGYYVLESSKQRMLAWQWVRFLLDHEEAAGLMLPPLKEQARSDAYAARVGEEIAAVARTLPAEAIVLPAGADPIIEQAGSLYTAAVAQVIAGEMDVERALNDAQVQAEKLFAQRSGP